MKNPLYTKGLVGVIAVVMLMACSHSLWDNLPTPIAQFISTYYPGSTVSSFNDSGENYYVVVKDGPTMVFNSDCKWTLINGNGVPLPSIFFFNELPVIYNYLEPREETDQVMIVENYPRSIMLTFSDHRIEYIKETGEFKTVIDTDLE